MKKSWIVVALLAAAASLPAEAASARCGSKLVSTGDQSSSVEAKCGAPVSRQYSGTTCTWGVSSVDCRPTETWTYSNGPGQFLQILVFSGNTLVAVKQGDRAGD